MSDQPTSAAEARARVTGLARAARICMLTTTALDGRQVSRPMGLQEAEFDGELWFFASADSAKVRQIRVNPEVNIAFSDQKHNAWVSISGTATEGFDRAREALLTGGGKTAMDEIRAVLAAMQRHERRLLTSREAAEEVLPGVL